jgi:hypothetical protein
MAKLTALKYLGFAAVAVPMVCVVGCGSSDSTPSAPPAAPPSGAKRGPMAAPPTPGRFPGAGPTLEPGSKLKGGG